MGSPSEPGITPEFSSRSSIMLVQESIEVQNIPKSVDNIVDVSHDDVHIYPSFIEFTEASEGITCHQSITIKNAGRKPAFVRVHQPNSMAFQVKSLRKGAMVNPGLSVRSTVMYSFKRPSFLRAMIPIEINGKIIDYLVLCKLLVEGISVEPKSLDFDIVDIDYSAGIKVLTLKNEGGKSTRFSIDLGTNDLEITVKPMRGIVRPNKVVQLTVELIGLNEGIFFSEFWIKSVPNIRVPFKVEVIVPKLVIYHPNATGDFTLIDFSQTIANTKKYDSFVLRNVSSQVASYVVLGEIDNEVKCIQDIDPKKYPVYSAFQIRPIQGRIGPFEGIIFEVGFSPTYSLMMWRAKLKEKSDRRENDFMAFLRIVRVHVTEKKDILREDEIAQEISLAETDSPRKLEQVPIIDDDSSSTSTESSVDSVLSDVVRLCLHGEVEEARLGFEPDILYFGDLCVGEDSQRVIRVSNPLKFAPLVCRYVRNASARCYPEMTTLKPSGSIELLLKVRGKENVGPSFEILFDAMADSCESTKTRRRTKIKVGSYSVQCMVSVRLVAVKKKSCMSKGRTIFTDYALFYGDINQCPKLRKRRSLLPKDPVKPKEEDVVEELDSEITEKTLFIPKWKYKNVSDVVDCDVYFKEKVKALKTGIEVLIPLSPLQIYNVRMYPSLFAFGMVVPRSRNYRHLIAENLNVFPIMIRLTSLSSRCINFPEGNLVILPPGSIVKRLVEFRAHHFGKFNGYIDYVINDNHSFELGVTADIVEKQFSVDTRDIVFGKDWLKEEIYQPMDFAIQIKNKLNAKTFFRWDVPSTCCFFVEPPTGTVRGEASLFSYIYYKPDVRKATCTEITMKCESSSYITIRLSIPLSAPRAGFVRDSIDVGEISLNLPSKTIALLRNFEFIEVEYEVDSSSLIHGCVVEPLHGMLHPRGVTALEITLKFAVCCRFVTVIRVTVQKQLNLQLKITGNVSFPHLKLHPPSINLRRISASAYQHYVITATNVGTSVIKLNFALEEYPEFWLSLSSRREDPVLEDAESTFIAVGASRDYHLHFEPIDLASYAFYLPIVVNDILGPANMVNSRTLKPSEYLKQFKQHYNSPEFILQKLPQKLVTLSIDCTVAGHVIFFNKLVFKFNTSLNNVTEEFYIENREAVKERSVQVDTRNFATGICPFTIRWTGGKEPVVALDCIQCSLEPGERCIFMLDFHPKTKGQFTLEAPIYVRDELDGEMFNKLSLIGEYPASSIRANVPEIYLMPVPLKTATERKFLLVAKYIEKDTSIVARVLSPECHSGFYTRECLTVSFIDTDVVSSAECSELNVKVVFKSETPVSFRTAIEFSNSTDIGVCSVYVYAISDNCLLTTHTYLRNPNIDLHWLLNMEKSTSRTSESLSEDEDYDVYSPRSRQQSAPRISILSYFGRKSRISAERLVEAKLRTTTFDQEDTPENNVDNGMKTEAELKKQESDSLKSDLSRLGDVHEILEYPYFPLYDKHNEYEIYMTQTIKAVEEWLYSGPFKFGFYPVILSGITMSLSMYYARKPVQFKASSRMPPELGLSFIGVLESLVGPAIESSIGKLKKELPKKELERAICIYTLYDNVLTFLINHGAHLCHVSAHYLVHYDDYVLLMENTRSKIRKSYMLMESGQEKLSQMKFEARSKQCWLDVILQTFKCFVLSRIHARKLSIELRSPVVSRRSTVQRSSSNVPSIQSLRKQYETHEMIIRNINTELTYKIPSNNYSVAELFLLSWLRGHYDEERVKEWMLDRRVILNPNETKDVAVERKVENFDTDLSDSVVLITVTASYCPFVIEEFLSNRYIRPRNYEESLHNAICVVNAWRKIRLGFVISPLEIVYPNCIKMLMLITYLFNILPSYSPRTKIKFSCALSETSTREISFTNPTNHTISFLTLFFGNNHEFFKAANSNPIMHLNAHESTTVKVQFYANKIKKTKAYLLFCGSTIGPHFCKNQVFVLEGQADSLGVSSEYTITSKLYHVIDKVLTVNVQYENATEYEIWMSEERPTKPSTLKQTRWSELCLRKIPRRLFLNQKSIVAKEGTMQAPLSMTVACITPSHRSFWIIFQSKIGDFIIQINSHWQTTLTDNIVVKWDEQVEKCICSDQDYHEMCPLNLPIPIPSRNTQLWSCVGHMFQKTLDPKERLFWSRYLDTHIGLRLIRWLMGDSVDAAAMEFTHIFDATVTYNVTVSESSHILNYPKTFTISDVRPSTESTPMNIHISPVIEQLLEITLTLISVDGNERRAYTISFLRT